MAMRLDIDMISWATEQAETFLRPLGNRWDHTKGVVRVARQMAKVIDEENRSLLVTAAYLHDIGYAPILRKTGFHPLDGAIYIRSLGEERLACLVAHHSEARFEAALRGHTSELASYPREQSTLTEALIYCDMITGPTGQHISFEERIADILTRYGANDVVAIAIREALPTLAFAVERTQQLMQQARQRE